jgi:hypothetical protein
LKDIDIKDATYLELITIIRNVAIRVIPKEDKLFEVKSKEIMRLRKLKNH